MKLVASAIVALFATVAFANTTAPAAATTAPAATATAPAAHDAHDSKMAPAAAKTASTKEDCSKMTGEAKTKCETTAKATTHK